MTLVINKNSIDDTGFRYACNDLVCYKIVELTDIDYRYKSPYREESFYETNKTYYESLYEDPLRIKSEDYADDTQIRTKQLYAEIQAIRYFRNFIKEQELDKWKNYSTKGFKTFKNLTDARNDTYLHNPQYVILECIIPKHTWYYEGLLYKTKPAYTSESIRVIRVVE